MMEEKVKGNSGRQSGEYKFKVAKTVMFFFCILNVYIGDSVVGPTIPDLTKLFKTNYEEVARAVSFKSVGILLGSFLGFYLNDHRPHGINTFLVIALIACGVTIAIAPLHDIILFGASLGAQSIFISAITILACAQTIACWSQDSPLPVHAVVSAINLGRSLSPLVAQPFISDINTDMKNGLNNTGDRITPYPTPCFVGANITIKDAAGASGICVGSKRLTMVPYFISGGLCVLVCVAHFSLCCIERYAGIDVKPPEKKKENWSHSRLPCSCTSELTYIIFMISCCFVVYTLLLTNEISAVTFLYTIAVESPSLSFTSASAALLNTVFQLSSLAGKMMAGVISSIISIEIVLSVEIILQVVAFAGLAFLGLSTKTMFWTWTALSALFSGPFFPSVLAWLNLYINVTGLTMAVVHAGVAVGIFLGSWISGILYQNYGPAYLFYFQFACVCLVSLVLIVMKIISFIRGKKFVIETVNVTQSKDNSEDEQTPLLASARLYSP